MTEEATELALMRMADGELPAAEAAELADRIKTDPALAARFAIYSKTRRLLQSSFAPVMQEAPPATMIAAILAADRARAESASGRVIPLPPRFASRRLRARWLGPALAAGLAALVAGPAGWMVGRGGTTPGLSDPLAGAGAALATALQVTPSGDTLTLAGARVTLRASHPVATGVCREALVEAAAGAAVALACREATSWRVVAVVALSAGTAAQPASAEPPAIAAVLQGLGAAPPLDEQSEDALRRRGWE